MRRIAAALCFATMAPLHAQTGPPRPADEIPQRIDAERANNPGAKSDWEREREARDFQEPEVVLPPPPKGDLIEFFVTSASTFKFFIDPQSLSVGADSVVRYSLVARSPSGAQTVSYEGIRCESGLYRVYAFANDGVWSRNRGAEWRSIEPKSVQRWHNVLRGRFFCPNHLTIVTAAEGVDALRRGGHPAVKNTGI